VELEAALPLAGEEADGFEHVEMLRDRLTREAQPVLHREARAQLEQRLSVALVKLVEDGPPRGGGERFEHIGHGRIIGKS
jgi:hypothetical protein